MTASERIQLVCLDMAGTTVADDGVVERAFSASLDELGVHGPDQRQAMVAYVRDTMGTSKIEVFRSLFGEEDRAQAANTAFERAYDSAVGRGEVVALPGAVDCLVRLRSAGMKVALTTGFSVPTRELVVATLGWSDLVDLALSPADAGRGRPFPDMVLTAVLTLQVDAVGSVAVAGDTAADMESGRRAGASVVAGVMSGADGRQRLIEGGATDIISSVTELPRLLRID